MSGAISPLKLSRYELKYLIPLSLVEPICKFIEPRCTLDYYSEISPDGYYAINSLYLDSPTYHLLHNKRGGLHRRFNIRIRSYGDAPKPPYYFEMKFKEGDFSNKLRAKIDFDNWQECILNGHLPPEIDPSSRKNLEHFLYIGSAYALEPKILTQYRRRAYLSHVDDYARITFDKCLRYQYESEYNVSPDPAQQCHYDHEDQFPHPEDCVILELKCERKVPIWFIDLIRRFELVRHSFSKYESSLVESLWTDAQVSPLDLSTSPYFRLR